MYSFETETKKGLTHFAKRINEGFSKAKNVRNRKKYLRLVRLSMQPL